MKRRICICYENKYNFFEMKYIATENFYGWIDQKISYGLAAEQSTYYCTEQSLFFEYISQLEFNLYKATKI